MPRTAVCQDAIILGHLVAAADPHAIEGLTSAATGSAGAKNNPSDFVESYYVIISFWRRRMHCQLNNKCDNKCENALFIRLYSIFNA